MKIEEIKKLCEETISADEYFSCGDFRKALFVAISALEGIAQFEGWAHADMYLNDSLVEIEEIFN